MKIGSNDIKPATLPPAAAPAKDEVSGGSASRRTAVPEASATVKLSPTASTLTGVGGADPTFDASKVDRIAQAIREGKYEINAEAIADKLIVNASELLGPQRS